MDIDLRKRIRIGNAGSHLHDDCLSLQQSLLGQDNEDPLITCALKEISLGAASMASYAEDGSCNDPAVDVFLRIVCASEYAAIDPMYHTDKCPMRGYVTLRGVGTQYRTKPCHVLEYIMLRMGLSRSAFEGISPLGISLRRSSSC